jgi:hypothetical protein
MEENLTIYNQLREVPPEAQKKITGGRLNGMTDIKPMWRIEKLTETFGMCGFGWKAPIKNKEIIEGANGEKIAIVDIDLYVKVNGEWSEAIEGTGGSSFIANERNGLYTSDECFKMAYTDALSVACKSLGMGANVYWGDSKYNKPKEITTKEDAEKYVLTFGKYKDKTLKEICESDTKYINWLLYNEKTDQTIKDCITLITGEVPLTEVEQNEYLELLSKLNTLVVEKEVDYEKMLSHYKVKSNQDMTLEQLRDAIKKIESK